MSKEQATAFEEYQQSLSTAENEAVSAFFTEYDHHNFLNKAEKAFMHRDFENAVLVYRSLGVPLDEALKRLDIKHLGGFYARPSLRWFPLDSAAKIYPFSMAHGHMAVFRLSVYLTQDVLPELLQMALTFTIKRFPSFATTVKKGFFWHYLDTAKRRYSIEQEASIPCRPLCIARSGSQSFRVIYYKNRISVEFFHVLTDGFGGTVFLKTLLAEYLRLLGMQTDSDKDTLDIDTEPTPHEFANGFSLVPKTENASGFIDKPAVQMSGRLSRQKPCRVLHFNMKADKLKQAAKQHGATVTAYLLALIFVAVKSATDEAKGTVNIQVPVNMRKFYPLDTLRNFSMYCGIKLPLQEIMDAQSIVNEITNQLTEKASREAMSEMVTSARRIVSALRHIPLIIKTPAVKVVNGFLSDRVFSTTLSNLGVVAFPGELGAHVLHMDAVMGPAVMNRVSCALITCGGTATLSVTKATADPSFEEKLYDLLLSDGVTPAVEGSSLHEN